MLNLLWWLIGLQVNPLESSRLVDVGPAADKKAEAAKFRSFWGEKAELRHFYFLMKLNAGGFPEFPDDSEIFEN